MNRQEEMEGVQLELQVLLKTQLRNMSVFELFYHSIQN